MKPARRLPGNEAAARPMVWLRRRPLPLFLLIGLCVFALERWGPVRRGAPENRIEIGSSEIARLEELWRAQAGREPTHAELAALIEDQVREEILYREAKRLGLDHDDTIVRRRLAQKMEFLMQDTAAIPEASEDELRRFYEEHRERYAEPERFSFSHVFFSSERRGADAESDARALLGELDREDGEGAAWREAGDPFMLRREYGARSADEIAELLGGSFAEALNGLETGSWQGPVPSAYGQHLVRISSRVPARQPPLEEVRDRVLEDLYFSRRSEANAKAFTELRDRYEIHVATPEAREQARTARNQAEAADGS